MSESRRHLSSSYFAEKRARINSFLASRGGFAGVYTDQDVMQFAEITAGASEIVAISESMVPAIRPGQILSLLPIPPESVLVGDIISISGRSQCSDCRANRCKSTGHMSITHRVMEIQERKGRRIFLTKGDANETMDYPIPQDQYLGVIAISR